MTRYEQFDHKETGFLKIPVDDITLEGNLMLPKEATGLVLFAHGSGSSRHSPRNQFVAHVLQEKGLGTLLMDLLTNDEEAIDAITRDFRFDINLLSQRLVDVTRWVRQNRQTHALKIGYFGASTGAAAALVAAAKIKDEIGAVVSRGGRPDLAGSALHHVAAPTLLIVGGNDQPVIRMNEEAMSKMQCPKELVIVPGATHLFEEPGALEHVAHLAAQWFTIHLTPGRILHPT